MSSLNIAVETFLVLRDVFFDNNDTPRTFHLREKHNTQDDPFDEYIVSILRGRLPGMITQKAPGPLISPDLVIYNPIECREAGLPDLQDNLTKIMAIEVKKLERSDRGVIARSTGMDFNSTPPCGTVRIYDANDNALNVKGFYLFACLEQNSQNEYFVSAFVLCDGSILNDDFDLYMSITNQRQKEVGLGTFGDGANRNRPMVIFSNPLGANFLDKAATLISSIDLSGEPDKIDLMYRLVRKDTSGSDRHFFGYRVRRDVPAGHEVLVINEPFPQPQNRVDTTQPRGKFRIEELHF